MNEEDAVKRKIEKLHTELERHNEAYHTKDAPLISDAEYDKLKNNLIKLEEQYPKFKTENSPTQKIGYKVLD